MPLYNAATRARNATSISNQNQGGGSKKAGFPQQVGRTSAVSVAFNMTNPVDGKCCKLSSMNATVFPLARFSRPIGTAPGANRAKFL